jgi:hypothetical protein
MHDDPQHVGDRIDDLSEDEIIERLEKVQRHYDEIGRPITDLQLHGLVFAWSQGWIVVKEDGTEVWVSQEKLALGISVIETIKKL